MGASIAPTKGEQTKAAVVEAAYLLFLEKGFHGTSMRQIAARANLALGGIYNHFSSKEEIFAVVLDTYHPYHRILPVLESIEGATLEEFVRTAARQIYDEFAGAEAELLPLIFIEMVEFQGRHVRQLVEKIMPPMLRFMERFAREGGQLRSISAPVMFRTFMAMLVGFLLSEMLLKDLPLFRAGSHQWFAGMVDIYLRGVLDREA